jgi:glycosyltransferase involved in cell wall biosynthesis
MTKTPFFSIITICYNEEKNIEKTCKSISNQSYKNFEWIVIDGKSTDKTLEIIKKYKKNTTNIISEKDSGIYNAMNKGIGIAKGEYLLFINGGDCLKDKDVLRVSRNLIEEDKGRSQIYYGDLIYDNGEIVTYKKAKLNKKFFIKKTISHQATFITKKLFLKYGYYNERYKIVADYDFWIKTILDNHVKTKHLPLIVSMFDLGGVSGNYNFAKKHIKERNKVLLKHKLIGKNQAFIEEIKWGLLAIFKKIRIYNYLRRAYRSIIKR